MKGYASCAVFLATSLMLCVTGATSALAAPEVPMVEKYLIEGKLVAGENALAEAVKAN